MTHSTAERSAVVVLGDAGDGGDRKNGAIVCCERGVRGVMGTAHDALRFFE